MYIYIYINTRKHVCVRVRKDHYTMAYLCRFGERTWKRCQTDAPLSYYASPNTICKNGGPGVPKAIAILTEQYTPRQDDKFILVPHDDCLRSRNLFTNAHKINMKMVIIPGFANPCAIKIKNSKDGDIVNYVLLERKCFARSLIVANYICTRAYICSSTRTLIFVYT